MKFYLEKYKNIREKNGISSKEICRRLDISRTTLWKWENGKTVPGPDFVRMLAEIFNVCVSSISSISPEPKKESIEYVHAVESCNSLLDKNSFNQRNSQLKKSIATILALQDEINQASTLLNAIFNEMSSIFYIKDINLKYVAANKKFLQNLSLHSSYRVYGKIDTDFFPVKEAKQNNELDKEVLQKGKIIVKEDYIFGSRKKKWGAIEKHPIYSNNGEITGLICTCKDITQQRIAEEENKRLLAEKDILFTAVNSLDRTVVIVYERTPDNKPIYKFISNNIEKILGYSKDDLMKSDKLISHILHESYQKSLTEHFLKKDEEFIAQHAQIKKSDGTYIWADLKVQKRNEANGNISMLGILTI